MSIKNKKTFAIIGKPIEHCNSPTLHNYWLKKYKIDANYSLLHIDEQEIESVTKKIRNYEISGINVTLPYKQKVIPYIDKLVNDAKSTNSVNTIFLDNNNVLIGENTDVYGLQAGYLKELTDAKNKRVLIIGAGGVSPSVILSLQKSKIKKMLQLLTEHTKNQFL